MAKLEFNEENHQYFLDGFLIPSVSESIKPLHDKIYKSISENVLEIASDKGTRVHRAIEFMSKYNLNKFDEDISGYIEAYKKFRKDNPTWKLLYSEYRTYNKSLLYGLTIDEVYVTEKGILICDLKTTSIAHLGAWSVQLSAYKAGFESQYPEQKVSDICVLQIFKDGKYIFHELKDNFPVFLSCLEIHRFGVEFMNKIEIQKQSLNIQEIADSLMICDEECLKTTLEILKAIKRHKKIIEEYWKNPKEATKKAYQEIFHKEKEMLDICENSEKLLKDKILNYKQMQEKKQKELLRQAETERKSQLEKVLNEAMELKNQGNYKQAEMKLAESKKLKRISLSLDLFSTENKITTQKRWKCKVTDNQLVPCFFNGVEIREINTKKATGNKKRKSKY